MRSNHRKEAEAAKLENPERKEQDKRKRDLRQNKGESQPQSRLQDTNTDNEDEGVKVSTPTQP